MKTRLPHLRILTCCLVALLGNVCMPAVMQAGESSPDNAIKINKIHIGKLDKEIKSHLEKIRKNSEKEVSLLDELQRIDEKLAGSRKKLADLKQQLAKQQDLLNVKLEELSRIKKVSDKVRRHLEKRLRSFYLMGKTGFLNVVFSRKNLPELMLFNDAFKQMLQYDQSIISRYRNSITELTQAKKALELEKNILVGFVQQAEKEKQALNDIRMEKTRLLARIKSKKGLYEQAVREMQRAEQDLTKALATLQQAKKNKLRGFLLNKGRMQGPVEGNLIVHFGELVDNNPCKGIIIHTQENSPVVSIFTGKVIFAGYKLGYGNMVIIDHGLGYYTITAHLDEVLVQDGDRVLGGQQIGTTGDIATLFSRGLYFEIRKNSKILDPLQWLSPSAYPKLIPLPRPTIDKQLQQPIVRERILTPGQVK